MNFSIYSSLYKIKQFSLDLNWIIKNWVNFLEGRGEIVIAVNDPDGNDPETMDAIQEIVDRYYWTEFKIIRTKISYSDNEFDGKLKNAALQKCDNRFPLKIQMDADEIFPEFSRPAWDEVGEKLMNSLYEAAFVPSIDLYGSKYKIRKNHQIGSKWRIHKNGLKRGVWRRARLENGIFNTEMSDSCELLTLDNELVNPIQLVPRDCLNPESAGRLAEFLYTFHLGYLALDRRAQLNKNWWSEKWSDRSGKKENVVTSLKKLKDEPVIPHNLPIWAD